MNLVLVIQAIPNTILAVSANVVLAAFYIYYNIVPYRGKPPQLRLGILRGGYELVLTAITCFWFGVLIHLYVFIKCADIGLHILIINTVVYVVLLLILLINGIIRIFITSSQLGIIPRVCLLFFWWVPVANVILLRKFLDVSGSEYEFTIEKVKLNLNRKHEQLCKTKYPLLMVHGIFFRDWKAFNYWGRIPKELTDNGATIYYGSQESSASVEHCAGELKQCILNIIHETGCEKVNIIAHSKGGLDSRYAISCLGMGEYVASLTTINTPHRGCNYVRKLLEIIPKKAVSAIGNGYGSIYRKLGDENPDFFSGLVNLTDLECDRLNGLMKDHPNVLYQSVGSRMRSSSSAMFPLDLGFRIIKLYGGGDNDGLVSTKSMEWGSFLGIISPKGKQGISHADVIDLTRKDMEGFDVREFYVDLVNRLKLKGL